MDEGMEMEPWAWHLAVSRYLCKCQLDQLYILVLLYANYWQRLIRGGRDNFSQTSTIQ